MTEMQKIISIENLIIRVKKDYVKWDTIAFSWFRGEPSGEKIKPLLPSLYRSEHNENRLLQQFRVKAPALSLGNTPPVERTDQWLFLAQHVRLPTRLLDWTEGLLIALHFALQCDDPVVWMLNPHKLNLLTHGDSTPNAYAITWLDPPNVQANKKDIYRLLKAMDSQEQQEIVDFYKKRMRGNMGNINIKSAWENDIDGTDYPVAILPTYVHSRLSSQKSRFTIWGNDRKPLHKMENIDDTILRKYVIDESRKKVMKSDLQMMGITPTSIFSDLDNLAIELKDMF